MSVPHDPQNDSAASQRMIRYRPADAIRWLESAPGTQMKKAGRYSKTAFSNLGSMSGETGPKARLVSAAKALAAVVKSAAAEISKSKAEAQEFAISESSLFISEGGSLKEIPFAAITGLDVDGFTAVFHHAGGSFSIKPYGLILVGSAKAPIGWDRDGQDVPFDFLIEEIAARCGLPSR